jgi:NADPH:quinone reductase
MRGLVTDSRAAGGLRLADDLPEPKPAGNELVLAEVDGPNESALRQPPDGPPKGQGAGTIVRAAHLAAGIPQGRVGGEGGRHAPLAAGWVA